MADSLPNVRIIATGGSIAGVGPNRLDYILYPEWGAPHLLVHESIARIPELKEIAQVQGEDIVSVGSTAIGPTNWIGMSQRINKLLAEDKDLSGVVMTHGTATLEETAYFLHLTIKSSKPVVITGAMRPPTALGTDADLNLLDAVRIAASPDAVGKGVLTVLNNQIHSAREASKANAFRVETFKPNELGFLGYADSDGKVVFYRSVTRGHTTATPFDVSKVQDLPRVDIVYAYAGADGLLVDAVRKNRSKGLIVVGFGGGTYPPAVVEAAAQAVNDGIPVVLATRATSGRVVMTPKKQERGFIVSDDLQPQKARILLMLALNMTNNRDEIQDMFYQY